MYWIFFALSTAFFDSLKDVVAKKSVSRINEYLVAWSLRAFSLPIFIPLFLWIEKPVLKPAFFTALVVSGFLNLATTFLYIRGLKHSDISLCIPILSFSPAFLLLTSPLITGEIPSLWGIAGILFIMGGSYVMLIKKESGIFAPFKALKKDRGLRIMLLVAFLWSISANFDKIGIKSSSPLFWGISVNFFLVITLLPLMLWKFPHSEGVDSHTPFLIGFKQILQELSRNIPLLFLLGSAAALSLTFHCLTMKLTLVAYAVSVKRTNILLSVVWGKLLFREKNFKSRFSGALLMLSGVLIIGLLG